jgi:hypothetical protein
LPTRPQVEDRLLTVVDRAPEKTWANAALQPPTRAGRLFCQTLLPRQYRVILHGDGRAEAFTADGRPLGATDGNAHHLEYGRHVVQIDPGDDGTKTVFLHVLTATGGAQAEPPKAICDAAGSRAIDVTVDGETVRLDVAD